MLLLIALASALWFLSPSYAVASGICTLCASGVAPSLPNEEFISGSTCGQIHELMIAGTGGVSADSQFCHDTQIDAFKKCGCPTFPEQYCSLCEDGEFEIPSDFVKIPGVLLEDNPFCGNALFSKKSDGHCDATRRAAYHCGCPNAPTPICQATCRPPNSQVALEGRAADSTPAAQRLLPPLFQYTCDDMYELAPFMLTEQECSSLIDEAYNLVDENAYCCSETVPSTPTKGCDLCEDSSLLAPGAVVSVGNDEAQMTCRDLQILSFLTTDSTYCETSIKQQQYIDTCCFGITSQPSGARTATPSSAPTLSTSLRPTKPPSILQGDPLSTNENGGESGACSWRPNVLLCGLVVVISVFLMA